MSLPRSAVATAAFVAIALSGFGSAAPADASGLDTPVIADNFPDPSILLENGVYYAYSTNHGQPDCWEANVPFRTSTDLQHWQCVPGSNDAMPQVPVWATKGQIWAPSVGRLDDGRYALYFSSSRAADGHWCVGAAFSSHGPSGPFVSQQVPLVCQDDQGGTIDPAFFRDVDGRSYLLYKSNGVVAAAPTRIWISRLSADGARVIGVPTQLLETGLAWEGNVIENPSMVHDDGHYYLFYSANDWFTDRYAIGYALCASAVGPCARQSPHALLESRPGAIGPGAPVPFRDATGTPRLAYHAWTTPPCLEVECGNRSLFIARLRLRDGTASLPLGGRALAAPRSGYWMVDAAGIVYPFGGAQHHGDLRGRLNGAFALDLEPTPTGTGYWILDTAGRVSAFGDARRYGDVDLASLEAGERVASLSATPAGDGYQVFTNRGRVLTFGSATFAGDLRGVPLNAEVLDAVATPSGLGYYMVAADGGVFAFGDARFVGSMGGAALNEPVQGLVPDPDGVGYWLVAADGGVFTFGAQFRGSMGGVPLNRAVVGMVPFGDGYLMVGSDGGIFNFSDRSFYGSLGASSPAAPVVAVAATG